MKTSMFRFALPLFVLLALGLSACKKDKKKDEPQGLFDQGFFINNEGTYAQGNATLSYYSYASHAVTSDAFSHVNARPLGDQLQSSVEIKGKLYLLVQNSQKVEIVDAYTLKAEAPLNTGSYTISPRYMIQISDQEAYLSDWNNNAVLRVDLGTQSIIGSIPVGAGPDQMVKFGDKVYVANSGGYGNANTVSVINSLTHSVVQTITVGDNPNALVLDKNNLLWVMCAGKWLPDYSALQTTGSIHKINTSTDATSGSFAFSSLYSQPSDLISNATGDKLYYSYDGSVYTLDISASILPSGSFIPRNFYGISFDKTKGHIYGCLAPNFVSAGRLIRYNSQGIALDSVEVGIGPNGCTFHN